MSRSIEFTEDKIILHLTGLSSVVALKRNVESTVSAIKNVSVEGFEVSLLQFRIETKPLTGGLSASYIHTLQRI